MDATQVNEATLHISFLFTTKDDLTEIKSVTERRLTKGFEM